MTNREQLVYLMGEYYLGNYKTDAFADELYRIYDLEIARLELTPKEQDLLGELSKITSRFSPHEKDHLLWPGTYYTEAEVKEKATEVYQKLGW